MNVLFGEPVVFMQSIIGLAHEEDGHITGVTDFDYDAVSRGLGEWQPESDLTEMSAREMEGARYVFKQIAEWVYQGGTKNPEGVKIRAIIFCWVFLEWLHPLTMTKLARGYAMDKQSIGRWVEDFKRCFPDIRTCHMR